MWKRCKKATTFLIIFAITFTSITFGGPAYAETKSEQTIQVRESLKEVSDVLPETVKENRPVLVDIDIPTDTYAKTYEDGRAITDPTSQAYKWISKCVPDERGHYMYGDYHAIAMGNYFDPVGSKYLVTLSSGKTFKAIKCDVKQDRHTTDKMVDASGAMIEFIINSDIAGDYYGVGKNGYVLNGSFNNHESFKGEVVKIELIKEI